MRHKWRSINLIWNGKYAPVWASDARQVGNRATCNHLSSIMRHRWRPINLIWNGKYAPVWHQVRDRPEEQHDMKSSIVEHVILVIRIHNWIMHIYPRWPPRWRGMMASKCREVRTWLGGSQGLRKVAIMSTSQWASSKWWSCKSVRIHKPPNEMGYAAVWHQRYDRLKKSGASQSSLNSQSR